MEALSRLIILTATRCLHGDDVRELVFEDVARLFHDLGEGMTPLSLFLPNFPTPTHIRRDKVGDARCMQCLPLTLFARGPSVLTCLCVVPLTFCKLSCRSPAALLGGTVTAAPLQVAQSLPIICEINESSESLMLLVMYYRVSR